MCSLVPEVWRLSDSAHKKRDRWQDGEENCLRSMQRVVEITNVNPASASASHPALPAIFAIGTYNTSPSSFAGLASGEDG